MFRVEFTHDRRQIIVRAALAHPEQTAGFTSISALIDTGAVRSAVTRKLAQQLTLPLSGKRLITTPAGEHMARFVVGSVGFFGSATGQQTLPYVLPEPLIMLEMTDAASFDVLIGMDILGWRDFVLNADGSGHLAL